MGATLPKIMFCLLLSLMAGALCFPEDCFAWGVGIHIADGLFVLGRLSSLPTDIASVLALYPYDYLYGCISADVFIGKGYKRHDDHCHNWSVGMKMLTNVETKSEEAFMYGYLSHLAGDIIAHNYYIPNQLYLTPTSRRIGHVYWEIRSDSFMDPKIWKVAMRVVGKHNKKNDRFMRSVIKKNLFPFFAKKRAYHRTIKMHNIQLWRRAFTAVSNYSKWEVNRDYIMSLNTLSLNLVMDFLKNPETAVCLKYDPVGTDNMIAAKKMRRLEKKNSGVCPTQKIFEVPEEIRSLAVVDSVEGRDLGIHGLLDGLCF